jgi:hypothetical protein
MRNLGGLPIGRTVLIDTGASQTAIASSVVAALHPQDVGRLDYLRPDQPVISRPRDSILVCFEPDLGDPDWVDDAHWFTAEAVEANIATPGVDVVVGQDLLSHLALSWDGPRGRLLLMY